MARDVNKDRRFGIRVLGLVRLRVRVRVRASLSFYSYFFYINLD